MIRSATLTTVCRTGMKASTRATCMLANGVITAAAKWEILSLCLNRVLGFGLRQPGCSKVRLMSFRQFRSEH